MDYTENQNIHNSILRDPGILNDLIQGVLLCICNAGNGASWRQHTLEGMFISNFKMSMS